MLPSPQGWPAQGLQRLLRGLTLLLSVVFVLLFLLVAYRRLHYPFEVDRMESGMMTSVWRLRHGYALYSPPSLQWAPFLYAPLFFYTAAAMSKLVGVQYAALRLVSILATLGSFGLIYALVRVETGRRWMPAVFSIGLFACLYPYVLGWYDVGRVDALSLFLFLAALLATRRSRPVLAAMLWLLAFLTKQTFLPLGLALFLMEWRRPKRMLTGMVLYLLLVAGSFAWLQHTSGGWFRYYAFGTAGVIKWSFHTAVMFPFTDLLGPLPIACGLILLAALCTRVPWREAEGSYFAVVTFFLTGAIWFVRAHVGANVNAIIPLYAWLAVLAGIALDRLLTRTGANSSTDDAGSLVDVGMADPSVRADPTGFPAQAGTVVQSNDASLVRAGLWLLAAVQLLSHLYRPAEIPTGNLAARMAFVAALRATPGDVWVVDHSFDAILAGKPVHADMDALDAVLGRGYAPAVEQFRALSRRGAWTAVVLDRDAAAYQPEGLFTRPPFAATYRLRAIAPGGGAPGDLDQPMFTLLPCNTPEVSGTLMDLSHTLVATAACGGR